MNNINKIFCDDILNIIYGYEHNLKYSNVMDELERLIWGWKIRTGCMWGEDNEPKGEDKYIGFIKYLSGGGSRFLKNKKYNDVYFDNWF